MKDKILKLRRDGLTYDEIKNKLKCSKSTISYHCKKANLGDDLTNLIEEWDIDINEINFINNLYENKHTNDEIYIESINRGFGITKHKIEVLTRKFRNGSPHNKKIIDSDLIIEMQNYYDIVGSTRKVSEKFNISRHQVLKYVQCKNRHKKTDKEKKEQNVISVISYRRRTKIKLVEYKGGECEKCGYKALEFHHLDPNKKDFTIGGKSWSFERLKKEVDKCILVCSNCHKEIHDVL